MLQNSIYRRKICYSQTEEAIWNRIEVIRKQLKKKSIIFSLYPCFLSCHVFVSILFQCLQLSVGPFSLTLSPFSIQSFSSLTLVALLFPPHDSVMFKNLSNFVSFRINFNETIHENDVSTYPKEPISLDTKKKCLKWMENRSNCEKSPRSNEKRSKLPKILQYVVN